MYENNKKGLYAYMSMMNCVYLLADTPDYLKEKDYTKTSTNNTTKGYYAS
nr:MAG TPA: Terminase large subunit [Caudoviricetes sp.]